MSSLRCALVLLCSALLGPVVFGLGCAPLGSRAPQADVPADWNPRQIAWRPYVAGLAEARASGKPVVLIFYTDWCPHCHNYSRVFYDREVVELAARFVMVRVERDGNRDLSGKYNLDGEYIPRTFFLRSDGELLSDLDNGSSEYRYYLDEHGPAELLSLMHEALQR
jgi:thiol:disulfide interchange protein